MDLAINGGEPVRTAAFHQWPLKDEDVRAQLADLFERHEWGLRSSSKTREIEQKFAWHHDTRYSAAVMNAQAGFEAVLRALKVGAGDEVLVPAYGDPVIPCAVVACNAIPVFIDIKPERLELDPKSADQRVTERTKALIVSHLAGSVADLDETLKMARKYGLKVIEDCSEAPGAEYDSRKVGSIGDAGVFCFGENRLMTSGQGGLVISNSKDLIERCHAHVHEGRWPVEASGREFVIGGSRAMSSLQAAVLLPQLAKLDDLNTLRSDRRDLLRKLLHSFPGVQTFKPHERVTRDALQGMPLRINTAEFNNASPARLAEALVAEGIPASAGHPLAYYNQRFRLLLEECPYRCRHYPFPYYLSKCPMADEASKTTVVLDHLVLLEEEDGLKDVTSALDKLRQLKHQL